jgi:hypothetical protein
MSIEKSLIEMLEIGKIKPSEKNAKEHTDEQIEQLRASIRQFGFRDPIGVDAEGLIIEGHGRYMAAVAEGLTEVPVIRLTHLSDKEREAYAIAHNQTQLRSGFELPILREELNRLEVSEGDFVALGFSDDDVHFLGFVEPEGRGASTEEHPTDQESAEWNNLIQPIIKTTIRFSSEAKYLQFMQLVDALGRRYPDQTHLSGRLLAFSREFHTIG